MIPIITVNILEILKRFMKKEHFRVTTTTQRLKLINGTKFRLDGVL